MTDRTSKGNMRLMKWYPLTIIMVILMVSLIAGVASAGILTGSGSNTNEAHSSQALTNVNINNLAVVNSASHAIKPRPLNVGNTNLVISQVYGGGGNTGATYRNDFVEIFNPTTGTISFAGWSVQYASATGVFTTANNQLTVITGTIPPGGFYLVQEAAGANITTTIPLPTPDATGFSNLSATVGKIALVNVSTPLNCGSNHTTNTCIGNPNLVDYVGFGATAADYEGTAPTSAPSNTTGESRALNGCQDTDNNVADFATTAPNPRNSSSPTSPCLAVGLTDTPTSTAIVPTLTPIPPTDTVVPTSTDTTVPTDTPSNTPTDTPLPTNTATVTLSATNTNTSTRTNTAAPTNTSTRTSTNTVTNTVTRTNTSTSTLTPTAFPTCGTGSNYRIITSAGSIVPGTTDIGNHTDDGTTTITLPFPVNFYGETFTTANVSSNGNLQFVSNATSFSNVCLPTTTLNYAMMPYWDDLRTDGTGVGIFTTTTGAVGSQIFYIEYRTCIRVSSSTCSAMDTQFEIALYENQTFFDFIYGAVSQGGSGATVGTQNGSPRYSQWSCNVPSLTPGLNLRFEPQPCGVDTFTPTTTSTATATNTVTATSTRTGTNTATASPTAFPTCGPGSNYVITQSTGAIVPGTTDIGNHTDDGTTAITLPFPVNFYGQTFTTARASSNGNLQFVSNSTEYFNGCLPTTVLSYAMMPYWDDLRTDGTGVGIFTTTTGAVGSRIFYIEYRTCIRVSSSTCSAMDTQFEIALYEGQTFFDFIYGPATQTGSGATVGVQNGAPRFTQYECNTAGTVTPGLSLRFTPFACGADTFTPTRTSTATSTVTLTITPESCGPNSNYNIAQSVGTIVPGTVLIPGTQCDDCVTAITLPFGFRLYDQTFTSVNLSSNGNLQFGSSNTALTNSCLPASGFSYTLFPHWDDLDMVTTVTNTFVVGVYTSVVGAPGSQIFNIEYRACLYQSTNHNTCDAPVNFEARLYENSPVGQFDFVYGQVTNNGSSATSGVQKASTGPLYTQFSCNTAVLTPGLQLTFAQIPCVTITPTLTSTPRPTETSTPAPTDTNTATPTITDTPSNTPTETAVPATSTPSGTATITLTPTCGPSSIFFDTEPNNTIITAQNIGTANNAEVRGGIQVIGDVDYYRFEAVAGDRIWAYLFTLGATTTTDSELTLLDTLSNTVQFDDDNGAQTNAASAIANALIPATGTYYLRVNAFGNNATLNPYTLFVDRTSGPIVPEVEPNDTFPTSNSYVVGSVVTGSIPITTDLDVYNFVFFNNERLVFQVEGDPERDGVIFDPIFDLINSAGATLVTIDGSSFLTGTFGVEVPSENAAFSIGTGGPPTATLGIRIRSDASPLPGTNSTGTYTMHIYRTATTPCGITPTSTSTSTATSTRTFTSTPTISLTATITSTPVATNTSTAVATSTSTSTNTAVATNTPTGTSTAVATSTSTGTSTAIPTLTITPSVTPTQQRLLQGHVTFEGGCTTQPITLTLRSGSNSATYNTVTDPAGNFVVDVSNLPCNMTYTWWLKAPKWLANSGTLFLPCTPVTSYDFGQLRAGDANNDNQVDISDFNIVRNAFGRQVGEPGYDSRADFNCDNRITSQDYTYVKKYFGQAGPPQP